MKDRKTVYLASIILVLVLLSAAIILIARPHARCPELVLENIENMILTAEFGYDKPEFVIDRDEWSVVMDLINTARRSYISEQYRPTYGEMYPVHYTLTISANDKGERKTYSLLLYHHKDWDLLHGEYEYKLALTCSDEDGKSEIWGLPYDECMQLKALFREKSDVNNQNDRKSTEKG